MIKNKTIDITKKWRLSFSKLEQKYDSDGKHGKRCWQISITQKIGNGIDYLNGWANL